MPNSVSLRPLGRDHRFLFIICLVLIAVLLAGRGARASAAAYVEPGLTTTDDSTVAVIVGATDVSTAARAVLAVGGAVQRDLYLIDAVSAVVDVAALDSLAGQAGVRAVVANRGVTAAHGGGDPTWDGEPEIAPGPGCDLANVSAACAVWDAGNPVTLDVGADAVHAAGVTGAGVGVALLDSGVYFDEVLTALDGQAQLLNFLGQADFVDPLCVYGGSQHLDHCFADQTGSVDPYGHGTHLAGVIGSGLTDLNSGAALGVAPGSNLLSVRVLDGQGRGTYDQIIAGLQYVVDNQAALGIRVVNLSLSAEATVPYFVDPLNRAVEAAWAAGLIVVTAAGNGDGAAESITVPGNDPYVITVGSVNGNRTAAYWADDTLAAFSAAGPTADGFVKPDVLAPGTAVASWLHSDGTDAAALAVAQPVYAYNQSFFRLNGSSVSTAVVAGLAALMLEQDPSLAPDDVKFRLMVTAVPAFDESGALAYSPLQQGAGRVWAPTAVLSTDVPAGATANGGMDLAADLAHGWQQLDAFGEPVLDANGHPIVDPAALAYHNQGLVQRVVSDDALYNLYYSVDPVDQSLHALGASRSADKSWATQDEMQAAGVTFNDTSNGSTPWNDGSDPWNGGFYNWSGGFYNWSGGFYNWSGGFYNWSGGFYNWSGGFYNWSGGFYNWSGGFYNWSGGFYNWSGGFYNWSGNEAWAVAVAAQPLAAGAPAWAEDPPYMTIQTISLAPGWNLVGANVDVQGEPVSELVAPIAGALVMVRNGQGDTYWPAMGVDDIGAWDYQAGYQIYVTDSVDLPLKGYPLIVGQEAITLDAGWNMVSFLGDAPTAVETAVAGIAADLVLVKDAAGRVYWPAAGVNTLGDLQPGRGYMINVTQPTTLIYQTGAPTLAAAGGPPPVTHFTACAAGSEQNATILIPSGAWLATATGLAMPAAGDELAVFGADGGDCAGAVRWESDSTVTLTVWGVDAVTTGGLHVDERLTLRFWDASAGVEMGVQAVGFDGSAPFDGSGRYAGHGLYRLTNALPTAVTLSGHAAQAADSGVEWLLVVLAISVVTAFVVPRNGRHRNGSGDD